MSYPSVLGLHGPAGAGKDTTYERLVVLGGDRFVRFSIADPMKDSISALLGIDLETLDRLKRSDEHRMRWTIDVPRGEGAPHVIADQREPSSDMAGRTLPSMTMREFMQRYGTEAHRDIFGEDFWLKHWLRQVEAMRYGPQVEVPRPTIVNTSVRFPNEAEAILAQPAGEIWQIVGPQDEGAAGHESEVPLPPGLVTRYIDNSIRPMPGRFDDTRNYLEHLDDQIATILSEWRA